jgi:hypothetical protein
LTSFYLLPAYLSLSLSRGEIWSWRREKPDERRERKDPKSRNPPQLATTLEYREVMVS